MSWEKGNKEIKRSKKLIERKYTSFFFVIDGDSNSVSQVQDLETKKQFGTNRPRKTTPNIWENQRKVTS